jgi:UDP-glucose 4-epimerase
LAAEARIQPCIINPEKAIETNIKGTFNVLEACRHNNIKRIIYSSTSSAYGLKNKIPLKESMPKDCLNPYSVTKTCGEELCLMYHKLYGLESVIFRYFNVYGPRQPLKGQYAPIIGLFLRQKKNKQPLTVVGDGLQRRDFTHIEDAVKANYLASNLNNKECVGQIINVGTGKNFSILDIVNMLNHEHTFIPPRLGEAREILADTKKIEKTFGWKPSSKLQKYIMEKNREE